MSDVDLQSLSLRPKTTFYSLPREIRDIIYDYALCTLPSYREYFGIYDRRPINIVDIARPQFERPWEPGSNLQQSPREGFIRIHETSFKQIDEKPLTRDTQPPSKLTEGPKGYYRIEGTSLYHDNRYSNPESHLYEDILVEPELSYSYTYFREESYYWKDYWLHRTANIAVTQRNEALGLLCTSRLIYQEATERLDKDRPKRPLAFAEYGPNNWAMLWRYLHSLSPADRSQVHDILIHNRGRQFLRWSADDKLLGEGTWPRGNALWEPDLHPPLDPLAPKDYTSRLEVLFPGIRECMRMLGREGPPVRITIKDDRRWSPGMDTYAAQMTERFAQEETGGRVEVVWTGEIRETNNQMNERRQGIGFDHLNRRFTVRKGLLEQVGWKFVEVNVVVAWCRKVVFKVRWVGSYGR